MKEMTTMKMMKKNKLLDTFEADYAKKKIQAKIEAAKKKLAELAVTIAPSALIMDPFLTMVVKAAKYGHNQIWMANELGYSPNAVYIRLKQRFWTHHNFDAANTTKFYDQFVKVQDKIAKLEEKLNDN
jgi:hypothetical protein